MTGTQERLFGTDGIRGLAGQFPLDTKTVSTIGASLARLMEEKNGRPGRFMIGRDTRESGPDIEQAFAAGALSAGAECKSAGVITTPGVAFLTGKLGFDAGVVVSASHNPFRDNGIKVFLPSGRKLDEKTEKRIEADIFAGINGPLAAHASSTDASRAVELRQIYLNHLAAQADRPLDGLRIVLDCANGAASDLAPELFAGLGASVVTISNAPDGRNINLDCGSLHLGTLRDRVIEEEADFGAAFDGDADRALFVDEKGNIIDGDATLWVMAQYLLDRGGLESRTVVATVMSNIGLEISLASKDVKLIRTLVGDKYVLDELLKTGCELGGEQSGHIIFPHKSLVGDGMLTTLLFLEAITARSQSASEAVEGFARYPQVLVNVTVSEKRPFHDVPEIASAAKSLEDALHGDGRLLLRYSGTENLARVMIEGREQAVIEKQANELARIIKERLG
jgi:phosphoglucosamine mutase